jgi:hypothetical protein
MSYKPTPIATLIADNATGGAGGGTGTGGKAAVRPTNRFLALYNRSESGSRQVRERSGSVKRSRTDPDLDEEEEEGGSTAEGKVSAFESMEKVEKMVMEAKVIIGKVKEEVAKVKEAGPLIDVIGLDVIGLLVKWMEVTTDIQVTSNSVMLDGFAKEKAGGIGQKGNPRNAGGVGGDTGDRYADKVAGTEETGDPRKKKFVQAVREAEKATLIFNMDMGNVPIMNPGTMNRKFSLALKAKAAAEDGNANGIPKADTVAQLDDTLSMVKSMEYFGKTTKKVNNGDYFTIPVKLSYKDKDTRIAAETNLRKLGKVSCSVP